MSKETVLKKEFKEKDIQRLRNLMTGKYGEKTKTSVGFSKADEFHEEGDIWEVDGKKWTIIDGIQQNVTKLDKLKKLHIMPLLCPKCSKVMNNRNDKSYYKIHKTCFNCVIDKEHEIKLAGGYEEYQIKIKNAEIDRKIEEFKVWIEESVNSSNDSFISENGDIEKWVGKIDTSKVEEYSSSVIEYLISLKK